MAFAEIVANLDRATDDALKTWAVVSDIPAGHLLRAIIQAGLEAGAGPVPEWVAEIAREHDDAKRLLLIEGAMRQRIVGGVGSPEGEP